jgi:hypothetical protein
MLYKLVFLPLITICISISGQQCNHLNKNQTSLYVDYDSIRVILEDIYDKDQGIRQVFEDSIRDNSPNSLSYVSKIIMVDNENQKILLPIIERYGWIPSSKIGEKASDAIFYVIQHSELDLMVKYFPQLDSLAQIGESSKIHAAMMEDRLLMEKGHKQKYGTQATSSLRQDEKIVIWPIEEPDKVDSLRKAAGFNLTVNENAIRLKADYNPDEKLPEEK